MSKIQTKIFQYGNEKESTWPPMFPDRNSQGFFGYWDRETMQMVEGHPPRPQKFGDAPTVIQDSIDPFYHHGGCMMVDSRSKLRDIDKVCGTITTDKMIPADPSWSNEQKKLRSIDRKESMKRAIAQIDSDPNSILTEEQRVKCAEDNKRMQDGLPGFDAFNAAGRKNDKRGKRYKRS